MFSFRFPLVVKNLLIINIMMFFLTRVILQAKGADLNDHLSLHHHLAQNFKPYQFLTHIFMHANAGHLFSNMLGLLIFGRLIEEHWGAKRFLIFYIFCGIMASVPQYIVNHSDILKLIELKNNYMTDTTIPHTQKAAVLEGYYSAMDHFYILGASGAVYAIMGAAFYIFGNMPMNMFFIPVAIKLKYVITVYMIIEITGGLRQNPFDNVAHFAHIGGLIIGMIMVLIWERNKPFRY